MTDTDQIRRTIALYAMLLGDFRADEWADLFTDDAVWISNTGIYEPPTDNPLTETKGRDAILRIGQEYARNVGATEAKSLHFNSTSLIDVTGDTANAWCDFVIFHTDNTGFAITWRFTKRTNVRSGNVLPPELAQVPER